MPVEPFDTEAVIKQEAFPLSFVDQKAAEEAIQLFKKEAPFFFIEMDEPITAGLTELMPLLPKSG